MCDSFTFRVAAGNLPDPGKAQDFVKKLAQVLDDDERIRDQLETLVSPSCSCKQAEICVVSFENDEVIAELSVTAVQKNSTSPLHQHPEPVNDVKSDALGRVRLEQM